LAIKYFSARLYPTPADVVRNFERLHANLPAAPFTRHGANNHNWSSYQFSQNDGAGIDQYPAIPVQPHLLENGVAVSKL
jgi:hypothetical protein